eukprot:7383194-Prymnesium_polylepis.2
MEGVQRLSMDCITIPGAHYVHREISQNRRAPIIAASIAVAWHLHEAVRLFAKRVRHFQRLKFAVNKASSFFLYTLVAMMAWMIVFEMD